jgi:hypothetical protein
MVRKRVFGTSFSIWDRGNLKKARRYTQKRRYLSKNQRYYEKKTYTVIGCSAELNLNTWSRNIRSLKHRIKISNRRASQRYNMSAFFYAKICSLLARRRSSQPVQRVYWPENVIDWLGKWRPTCVMRHARGQKLQSFRRKWPFYMDLYSLV